MKQSSIEDQVLDILENYQDRAEEVVQKSTKKVASGCVKKLKGIKKFSPKSKRKITGDYAESWAKKKDGNGYVVYNKDHYQLTHLLEFGHLSKNQYGSYDRVPAYSHISDVEKWGINEYLKEIKKELEG